MLTRQKALLHTLSLADGRASRLQLVKWAFLIRAESPGGGSSFYDFVPYLKGPFSFNLYHEVSKLAKDGFLSEPDDDTWGLTRAGRQVARSLPPALRRDVDAVMRTRAGQPVEDMVAHVYSTYPWYTLNSAAGARVARPVAEPGVYTAGYEGRSVDAFLNDLLRSGVRRLIDVRRNPVARRYGFHGSTLGRLCGELGLDYLHFPELGIASEERRSLASPADYEALFVRYGRTTLRRERGAVREVARLSAEKPSVLVCFEADPARCHRTLVAKAVSRETGLPVRHVGAAA